MAYVYQSTNHVLIDSQFISGFPIVVPLQLRPSLLIRMDVHRSICLLQFMTEQGLVPSPEEEFRRNRVIQKLKEIVRLWIQRIAWQRNLPANVIRDASATILTYGSYGLGVHGSESDIDALCVSPWFATISEDFFIVLCNILKHNHEVSDIHCVKDAKVPLIRFKFDGIAVDFPYARLQVMSVPENVDLLNPMFLIGIDETSWKSLSGVRVNQRILQLVPNLENFQSLLRCVKFWAKRRGVYGNLFGFLGGIHLAILAAFVCQWNPEASLSFLVMSFFNTFASWPWPTPVALQDGMPQVTEDINDKRCVMPIRLPCSPYELCQSNITRGTFNRIRTEFHRGKNITKDFLRPDFVWVGLFEPHVYQKNYSRFLKIYLSAPKKDDLVDWVGWVKSRFRYLLFRLEEIRSCDPNPTEYVATGPTDTEPSVVFYWGLQLGQCTEFDPSSVEKHFLNIVCNNYSGRVGKMKLSVVQASELPSNTEFPTGKVKGMKACWRIPDYDDQRRRPVCSQHLANHVIGYEASEGDYASAWI